MADERVLRLDARLGGTRWGRLRGVLALPFGGRRPAGYVFTSRRKTSPGPGAATIGVAAEVYYSLELLRGNRVPTHLHTWRSAVAGRTGADTLPLTSLVPTRGPGLDLLALTGDVPSLDHAVDNLLHAPVSQLRREIECLDFRPGQLPWARRVAEGDRDALRELAKALRACHRLTVEPTGTEDGPNWSRCPPVART